MRPMATRHQKTTDSLADWTDVRPKSRPRLARVTPSPTPSVERFVGWMARFSDPRRPNMLVLPGSPEDRQRFLHRYQAPSLDVFRPDCIEDLLGAKSHDWVLEGPLANITQRLKQANVVVPSSEDVPNLTPKKAWRLIWGLIASDEFLVTDPLRSILDQEFHLVHRVYRLLWEARFIAREAKETPDRLFDFVESIIRWVTNEPLSEVDRDILGLFGIARPIEQASDRLNVLFLLVTLAEQNALINRAVFALNDLEYVLRPEGRALLRQLDTFLGIVDRWSGLGCPIGIVLGFDASQRNMALLKRLNPKLHQRVELGLEWVR